jgi:hypothetical protein
MTVHISEGPAIVMGYAYRLRLEAEGPLFPEGVRLVAQVRATVSADQVLAQLSTEQGGGLARVSDTLLDIEMTAQVTSVCPLGSVVMDFVRLDTDPDLYLGFALEIPVQRPVTRGL